MEGQGMAPGNPTSAFRAELFGLVAWHCGLYHIFEYYGLSSDITIQPYSDNTKLIVYHQHIINNTVPTDAYIDDYDIFKLLQHYHQKLHPHVFNIALVKKYRFEKTTNHYRTTPQLKKSH